MKSQPWGRLSVPDVLLGMCVCARACVFTFYKLIVRVIDLERTFLSHCCPLRRLRLRGAFGVAVDRGQGPAPQCSVILQGQQTKPAEAPRLQLSSGFIWDVGLDSLTPALPLRGESSDSEEEEEEPRQAKVLYLHGLASLAETPLAETPLPQLLGPFLA